MSKKISVCFPAFNEEKNIGIVLDGCINVISKLKEDCEIVVVNDGSSDKTEEVVSGYTQENKNVRLVNHPKNMGYSAAVNTCLRESKGELIFVIDSDRQYDLNDIHRFVEESKNGHDIIVGHRLNISDNIIRQILSKGYSFCFRMLFRTKDKDIDCGFRSLTREAANKIRIKHKSVPVGAELFAQIHHLNLKTARIQMKHYKRKEGVTLYKVWKTPFSVMHIFLDMLKLRKEMGKIKNESNSD